MAELSGEKPTPTQPRGIVPGRTPDIMASVGVAQRLIWRSAPHVVIVRPPSKAATLSPKMLPECAPSRRHMGARDAEAQRQIVESAPQEAMVAPSGV